MEADLTSPEGGITATVNLVCGDFGISAPELSIAGLPAGAEVTQITEEGVWLIPVDQLTEGATWASLVTISAALPGDVAFEIEVSALMRKDSLHLSDADRQLIRAEVSASSHDHVLITHGTDTMIETAAVLDDLEGKIIVLTGSLNPARFRDSDAVFNIGCAVGAVQSLEPGVYIAMNGRVWRPKEVRKNVSENRFESLTG